MIKKVYSIRDAKGELFNDPWFAHTHGDAERTFTRLVKDEKTTIHQFPEDYDLYFLGEFDDQRGVYNCLETPQHIIKAAFLQNASKPQ